MKTDSILFEGLDLEDIYRHLIVFGSTGSGKTWHLILPLLQQILACNADVPGKRAGCIVFDVKGDMRRHFSAVMKAAGRKDEIITIGAGGNCWFDPFGGLAHDSRAISERLMEIIRGIHDGGTGGAYDDFWLENLRRFLQVSVVIAKARGLGDLGSVEGIATAVSALCSVRRLGEEDVDTDELMCWLKTAERGRVVPLAEIEMARFYLETEAKNLAWNTWTVICNYAQSYVSCLRDSPLARILTPSASHQFVPEDIIDHGRVVIVCLTRIQFGPGAEVYRNLIKTAFQTCALQRHSRRHFDGKAVRPINATRPVLFVADEFPSLMTVGSVDDGDAFFLDKCRETKIGCIVSAQGISALLARTGSSARAYHLLNNCCCKIFMATDCPETLQYFEASVPEERDVEDEVLYHRIAAPAAFKLPNYEFAPPQLWVPISKSASRSRKRKFISTVLRELKTGEAIVLRSQGFAERMIFPAFKE